MRKDHDIDHEGVREARTVRAIVASLCVLGLASLMWVHSGVPGQAEALVVPSAAEATGSLRAPTTDPSLPSLEATFARKDDAAAEPAPVPTF